LIEIILQSDLFPSSKLFGIEHRYWHRDLKQALVARFWAVTTISWTSTFCSALSEEEDWFSAARSS